MKLIRFFLNITGSGNTKQEAWEDAVAKTNFHNEPLSNGEVLFAKCNNCDSDLVYHWTPEGVYWECESCKTQEEDN